MKNAKETLDGYVISLLEHGKRLPPASAITEHHADGKDFLTYISCDIAGAKCVRKNVTLPAWLPRMAENTGKNFPY